MDSKQKLKDIQKINGKQLYYSFVAGAQKIFEHQKAINKINVFPVPDGDTGTNLASTLRSIVDTSIPTKNFKETAVALADTALIGARGNSGIIFAQFLYGFSNELENEQSIDVNSFSNSVSKAVDYAYDSIQNPVEGTMITVIKDWAESMHSLKDKITDFNKLLADSYQRAKQSLLETKEKLEILARNKVVDAGAKGFVVFLEGLIDFFKNGKLKELLLSHALQPAFEDKIESLTHERFNFRYCTEALLSGDELDRCNIRNKLEQYGDSIVVAGSPKKVRVHVHTDQPAKLFKDLYQCGNIISQKVDDMIMQQKIVHDRNSNIALLTDSTCDLPQEIIEKYQIHVIPLSVHFGETHFLDQVTLKSSQFYKMFEKSKVHPSSAQPTIKEFTNKYNYLSTHYENILGIHLSKALSGTMENSKKSARSIQEQTGMDINIFDSRKVTGALGLIVLRTARAIEAGLSIDEIKSKINNWIDNCEVFVSVKTLKYMVRGGRVSRMKGLMGNLMNMKPIVSMDKEGKSRLLSKSFSEKGSMKKIYGLLEENFAEGKIWGYSITHVKNEKTAQWYAEKLKNISGKEPEFIHDASPVLGANTGPGTVAVSFMKE